MRAVTLGYDVGTRVTMSMGGPGYQAATHRSTHGTVAAFAAGASAVVVGTALTNLDARIRAFAAAAARQKSAP